MKITDEDAKEIRKLYIDGMSTPQIAKRFGVTTTTISYHLKKLGISVRRRTDDGVVVGNMQTFLFYIDKDTLEDVKNLTRNASGFIRQAVEEKLEQCKKDPENCNRSKYDEVYY